jgi:ferrous iron transport protein A
MTAAALSLTDLAIGGCAVIQGLDLPDQLAVCRRLEDLGFAVGATVEVVRRAPLGDPTIYRISDYEICLRRAQAQAIRVSANAVQSAS